VLAPYRYKKTPRSGIRAAPTDLNQTTLAFGTGSASGSSTTGPSDASGPSQSSSSSSTRAVISILNCSRNITSAATSSTAFSTTSSSTSPHDAFSTSASTLSSATATASDTKFLRIEQAHNAMTPIQAQRFLRRMRVPLDTPAARNALQAYVGAFMEQYDKVVGSSIEAEATSQWRAFRTFALRVASVFTEAGCVVNSPLAQRLTNSLLHSFKDFASALAFDDFVSSTPSPSPRQIAKRVAEFVRSPQLFSSDKPCAYLLFGFNTPDEADSRLWVRTEGETRQGVLMRSKGDKPSKEGKFGTGLVQDRMRDAGITYEGWELSELKGSYGGVIIRSPTTSDAAFIRVPFALCSSTRSKDPPADNKAPSSSLPSSKALNYDASSPTNNLPLLRPDEEATFLEIIGRALLPSSDARLSPGEFLHPVVTPEAAQLMGEFEKQARELETDVAELLSSKLAVHGNEAGAYLDSPYSFLSHHSIASVFNYRPLSTADTPLPCLQQSIRHFDSRPPSAGNALPESGSKHRPASRTHHHEPLSRVERIALLHLYHRAADAGAETILCTDFRRVRKSNIFKELALVSQNVYLAELKEEDEEIEEDEEDEEDRKAQEVDDVQKIPGDTANLRRTYQKSWDKASFGEGKHLFILDCLHPSYSKYGPGIHMRELAGTKSVHSPLSVSSLPSGAILTISVSLIPRFGCIGLFPSLPPLAFDPTSPRSPPSSPDTEDT
jgi:hypothetical protein